MLIASASSAQTTQPALSASLGFSGVFKSDAWTPVYVRASDADAPRPGTLELRTARGRLGLDVSARIVTTQVPSTYTLYAPVGTLDRLSLQLRDARGRLLRTLDLSDAAQATPAALGGPAFGVVGGDADAQRIVNQLVNDTGEYVAAGALAPRLLPEWTIGYSAIDCLVLASADFDAIPDDVQLAIVSWVRSGGILVAWPGAQAPTREGPLINALPATLEVPGEISFNSKTILGRPLVAREGAIAVDAADVRAIAQRRLGLGQIVMLGFDPSRLPGSTADRVALWRRLTSGQLSMSPDDRRVGVFDPLVAQAVAEQQLTPEPPTSRSWPNTLVPIVLLAGLLLGPGELVLLAAAGRHPRTWYTIAGVACIILGGVLWIVVPTRRPAVGSAARIELRIEAPDGLAAGAVLSAKPEPDQAANWLAADRSNPSEQSASELVLAQRDVGFVVDRLATIGNAPALSRSIRFSGETLHPAHITSNRDGTSVKNASNAAWSSLAIVRRDSVRISLAASPIGSEVQTADIPGVAADNSSTRRVETGIERLAAEPGWEAIFMDRRLSERLVRLLETEDVTIVASRVSNTKYTLQVLR